MNFLEPIETERLLIRPYRAADFPQVLARVSNEEVTRFTGGVVAREEARRSLESMIARQSADVPFGNRAIVLKATELNIGYCGLDELPQTPGRLIELSYGLNREYWGHGYATEAAAAMLEHGFRDVGLTEVVAAVHPRNVASRRVALKLGFQYRQKILWPGQGEVDLYGIGKRQFDQLRADSA